MYDTGRQYPADKRNDPSGFLAKARLHQSKYRAAILEVPCGDYGNYIIKEDAIRGANFYSDFNIFAEVKKRYPRYSKPLYSNMLRSEHIGFNLFVPLKNDLVFANRVFNEILSGQVKSIDRINIEYAPAPAADYLDDKTSFDTYVEYTHIDNTRGIIGIEVKYTERDYKIKKDSKQYRDINNLQSRYYQISAKSGLYKPDSLELLKSDRFRQVWRNQLLGESILIKDKDQFNHFTSVVIFPEGNTHFVETSQEYINLLVDNRGHFLPITYERFISVCLRHCPNERYKVWLNYLEERYILLVHK
jgi:hypothetical protein